ncbi:MAG: hypothetical protein K6U80_18620 [Firmicutes bacterium]|nr:hypothetical protein [Bacillota bacterium]
MNPEITIAFFPTRSRAGVELQEAFLALAQNQFHLRVEVYQNASQKDFLLAVFNHDLMVVDATIEADDRDSNYAIFTENPKTMEHVLIVSRSYLPINFFGFDESGVPIYPHSQTNADILSWLETKLQTMLPSLPREKAIITNPVAQQQEMLKMIVSLTEQGMRSKQKLRDEQGQIFISYRNKYYDQVMALKQKIEAGEYHQGRKKTVTVIPAGSLVWENELLTPQRRWGIVSKTDRLITGAEEMWVYYTPDYFESWWTQGELVILQHLNQNRTKKIQLHIFDPNEQCLRDDLLPAFTFELEEKHQQRITRWYSNSDDLTQAPELIKGIRRVKFWVNHLPPGMLDQYFSLRKRLMQPQIRMMKAMMENMAPGADTNEKFNADGIFEQMMNREWRKDYYNDTVWSEEFWEYPLLQCVHGTPLQGKMDLDDFLYTKRPLHVKLSPKQLAKAVSQGVIRCPGCPECPVRTCRAVFKIMEEQNSRYLWMPTRMEMIKHGDHQSGLRKLPVYRAERVK